MELSQNIKNKKEAQTLDIGAGFAILKLLNLTAFLRASGRRQFFYGK